MLYIERGSFPAVFSWIQIFGRSTSDTFWENIERVRERQTEKSENVWAKRCSSVVLHVGGTVLVSTRHFDIYKYDCSDITVEQKFRRVEKVIET